MKTSSIIAALCLVTSSSFADSVKVPENPAIQFHRFSRLTAELSAQHEKCRVSEEAFLRMMQEPGTLILDARSRHRYDNIRVKGAVHLALTDFTEDSLREVIPDKSTRILIYCNNNFENEPVNFPSKFAEVSLNIQTFLNLHAYGYTNVYELGPLLDIGKTSIPFEGAHVSKDGKPMKMSPAPFPGLMENGVLPTR